MLYIYSSCCLLVSAKQRRSFPSFSLEFVKREADTVTMYTSANYHMFTLQLPKVWSFFVFFFLVPCFLTCIFGENESVSVV